MSKAQAQRCAGPSNVGHFAPGFAFLLERQNVMTNAAQVLAQHTPSASAIDAKIRKFKERGVSIALSFDDDGAVIDAYVTSAVAARMLAPLGRKAIGQFHALPDNMVLIDAIVTAKMARRMLTAAQPTH